MSITDQPIICDEIPLEDFPDFDTALAAWRNDAADRACIPHPTDGPPALIVGQCKTADLFFLLRSEGDTAEIRFYDTTTRQFTARIRTAPGSDPVCHGRTYWPNDPDCFTGTITETLCGPTLRPGTVIPLP